jgi:hypothetical protein
MFEAAQNKTGFVIMPDTPKIRSRLKERRTVRVAELLPNEKNFRIHPTEQADVMRALLEEVGYVPTVVTIETPQGLKIIDGHLRSELMPDQEIEVIVADWTEEEAAKVLAAYDAVGGMAKLDAAKLDALLKEVHTSAPALQQMLTDLAEEAGAIPGMGGKDATDDNGDGSGSAIHDTFNILIECKDEKEQARWLKLLNKKGMKCRSLIS